MLCQKCHKNEATIHVQKIEDGKVKSLHLCESCAAKHSVDAADLQGFNLAEVLFDIAGKVAKEINSGSEEESESVFEEVCPHCGWSLEKFRKTGYLGCPECYQTFDMQIDGMLKNIHRGDHHIGKIPVSAGAGQKHSHEAFQLKREIERLRKEQEEKIRREEYEDAAVLRDRIQELEQKIRQLEVQP